MQRIGFESSTVSIVDKLTTWRQKRGKPVSVHMQTDEFLVLESPAQTDVSALSTDHRKRRGVSAEREAQTDSVGIVIDRMKKQDVNRRMKRHVSSGNEDRDEAEKKDLKNQVMKELREENDIKVEQFLERISAIMEEELDIGSKSHAFDEWKVSWKDEIDSIRCLHELTLPKHITSKFSTHNPPPPSCTFLSWNCTGSSLAAAFGGLDTTGWCLESGYISIWHLSSNALKSGKKQRHVTIEVEESHVTCVKFHPTNPDVLAAGTYDGGIKFWKLAGTTETLFAQSRMDQYAHRDPVVDIVWLRNKMDGITVLASASGDGKVMLWSKKLDPLMGFSFSYSSGTISMGLSCFSFARVTSGSMHTASANSQQRMVETDEFFIVGTESGQVHKASLSNLSISTKPKQVHHAVTIKECHTDYEYEGSVGYIYAISCSPFNRNIFLSASGDGMLRMYNIFRPLDVLTLQPSESGNVLHAEWSPFRPCVIACSCSNGHVYIYDLMEEDYTKPVVTMDVGRGQPILNIHFNSVRQDHIATADFKGLVKVWALSSPLAHSENLTKELAMLRDRCASGE